MSTGQAWDYDAERYAGLAQARQSEQQTMLEYIRTDGCRMDFLRAELDDPTLDPAAGGCGRCDSCGPLASGGGAGMSETIAKAVRGALPSADETNWPSCVSSARCALTLAPAAAGITSIASLGRPA